MSLLASVNDFEFFKNFLVKVTCILISKDDRIAYIGCMDGSILLYDLRDKKKISSFSNLSSGKFNISFKIFSRWNYFDVPIKRREELGSGRI